MTILRRFMEKFTSGMTPEACQLWHGAKQIRGYGRIWADGGNRRAHRVSYELFKGPIPEGVCVLHKCDTPSCVNPTHLFLGTHQDNMSDMKGKGHAKAFFGEKHALSKLTETIVLEIRKLHSEGTPYSALAAKFKVNQSTIGRVITRATWKHI